MITNGVLFGAGTVRLPELKLKFLIYERYENGKGGAAAEIKSMNEVCLVVASVLAFENTGVEYHSYRAG